MARGVGGVPAASAAAAGRRPLARPARPGRATGRRRGRRPGSRRRRPGCPASARRMGDVVVGEEQDLALRGVERGVAAPRQPGRGEARDRDVGPRRAAPSAGRARVGVRLLHQDQVVEPLGRRPAARRARARARRGSNRRRSGSGQARAHAAPRRSPAPGLAGRVAPGKGRGRADVRRLPVGCWFSGRGPSPARGPRAGRRSPRRAGPAPPRRP